MFTVSTAPRPTVAQVMDVVGDVTVAREAAGHVTYVRRTAKYFIHTQNLMTLCVRHLM